MGGNFLISNVFKKYRFDFLSGIKNPPIKLLTTGMEEISSAAYYLDNRQREECYLFQYTLSGSGTVVIKGKKHTVSQGSGFFLKIPDDDKYFFDEKENLAPWKFIYIKFRGDLCLPYYSLINDSVGNIFRINGNAKSILSLSEIYRRASLGLISDSFTGERLTFDFLCKLCFDLLNDEKHFSDIVLKAKKIIENEYMSISGIYDISQKLGVSQSHLSRVFSEELKSSPIEYLTKVRLQEAVNLLNESGESIESIANRCGFSCGNYFCKVFRKHMHISPSEYRLRNKEF